MVKAAVNRRTQAERRASTQKIILDATLKTLVERGYANTSMSSITEAAGLSKGAINHHFASKADLVASAMQYFYREVATRCHAEFSKMQHGSFEERMNKKYEWSQETLPLRLEFMLAMRTDTALREAYVQKIKDVAVTNRPSDPMLPEVAEYLDERDFATLMSAVSLGLGLMGTLDRAEHTKAGYDLFVELLENYFAQQRGSSDSH